MKLLSIVNPPQNEFSSLCKPQKKTDGFRTALCLNAWKKVEQKTDEAVNPDADPSDATTPSRCVSGRQRVYPASMRTQQNLSPAIHATSSALPGYGNPTFRGPQQSPLPTHTGARQSESDAGAGHNIQSQVRPSASSSTDLFAHTAPGDSLR
jgi:hypothetical protein